MLRQSRQLFRQSLHQFSTNNGKKASSVGFLELLDKAADVFLLTDAFRATWLAAEVHLQKKATVNYPFEKGPMSSRFRGEHALRRYPSGEER